MNYTDKIEKYIKDLNDMIDDTYSAGLHPARGREIRIIISECIQRFIEDFEVDVENDDDEDMLYPEMIEGMKWTKNK